MLRGLLSDLRDFIVACGTDPGDDCHSTVKSILSFWDELVKLREAQARD